MMKFKRKKHELRDNMKSWNLKMTNFGENTRNPLRKVWEDPNSFPNPNKELITLQIGDPTLFDFKADAASVNAIKNALNCDNFSYCVSTGLKSTREAISEYVNRNSDNQLFKITSNDVVCVNGVSLAIELCSRALANPGENILIPRPSWNYTTWICGSGIEVKCYNLDPEKDWQVDLEHLESLIDSQTRAIIVNSPGNPCGNVFSKEHILDILEIAEKHCLPIISDEVYEFFTYPGVQHYSFAALSKNVPILMCSGLTKRFMLPGVRMGWIVIHDRNNLFKDTRQCILNIAGRNFFPSSTIQLATPEILRNTPKAFFLDNSRRVYERALLAYNILKDAPGLQPIFPQGAMYMMIKIDLQSFPKTPTCYDFSRQLLNEQSVGTFSGDPCFNFPGFIRIVLTIPEKLIEEACLRIKEFCEINYKYDGGKYLKSK